MSATNENPKVLIDTKFVPLGSLFLVTCNDCEITGYHGKTFDSEGNIVYAFYTNPCNNDWGHLTLKNSEQIFGCKVIYDVKLGTAYIPASDIFAGKTINPKILRISYISRPWEYKPLPDYFGEFVRQTNLSDDKLNEYIKRIGRDDLMVYNRKLYKAEQLKPNQLIKDGVLYTCS